MLSKIFTTVKYMIVSVNFLFLITGIIVLAVGSSVQKAYNGYHSFLTERFLSLPAFCIATGIIIFLIASFGFYGAYKESYTMIMVYAGSILIMFVFLFSTCVAGYVLKGNTVALVQQQLYDSLDLYGEKKDLVVTKLWDEVQEDFSCCGVNSSSDWLKPLNTTESKALPISCCKYPPGTVHLYNCTVVTTTAYNTGCSTAFGSWVQSHIGGIALAGIFLIILQGLVVAGAIWLAKMMREEQGSYP